MEKNIVTSIEKMPNRGQNGRLFICIAALLYGTESVAVQLSYAGGFNSVTLMAVRYLSVALVLGIVLLLRGRSLLPDKGHRLGTLAVGLLQSGMTIFLFLAYSKLPATLAVLLLYSFPTFTMIIARIFYQVPLVRIKVIAIIIALAGLVLLYWSSLAVASALGMFYALLAAVFQACRLNVAERVSPHVPTDTYTCDTSFIVGTVGIVLGLSGFFGHFSFVGIHMQGWLAFLFLALMVSGFANYFTNRFVGSVGAVDTSLLLLLEPPATAVVAFFVFGDTFSGLQWLGAACVLLAVALPVLQQKFGKKPAAV